MIITPTHITAAALTGAIALGGALYDRLTGTLDNVSNAMIAVSEKVTTHGVEINHIKEQLRDARQ